MNEIKCYSKINITATPQACLRTCRKDHKRGKFNLVSGRETAAHTSEKHLTFFWGGD